MLLAAFAGYIGAWYSGAMEGNFALLLFLATVVTGVYWLGERFYFPAAAARSCPGTGRRCCRSGVLSWTAWASKKWMWMRRKAESPHPHAALVAGLDGGPLSRDRGRVRAALIPLEPFKIPSGSMVPTLRVGDLILVNKSTYGVRLPVIHTKIIEGNKPARGDVLVFRYPPQPSLDYIKRVVGVPGDEVAYLNKRLTINGRPGADLCAARLSGARKHAVLQAI